MWRRRTMSAVRAGNYGGEPEREGELDGKQVVRGKH